MKKKYEPELRSVPLTRCDCNEYSWLLDYQGEKRICNIHQPGLIMFRHPIDCKDWCDHKECPKGYQ